MPNKADLTLNEGNDETINVQITTNQPTAGTVMDLTGKTLEAYLKVSPATADTDASTWKGMSTGVTPAITVTDAVNGKASIVVPGTAVTATKGWYRVDVISNGLRKTAVYGVITILDL